MEREEGREVERKRERGEKKKREEEGETWRERDIQVLINTECPFDRSILKRRYRDTCGSGRTGVTSTSNTKPRTNFGLRDLTLTPKGGRRDSHR